MLLLVVSNAPLARYGVVHGRASILLRRYRLGAMSATAGLAPPAAGSDCSRQRESDEGGRLVRRLRSTEETQREMAAGKARLEDPTDWEEEFVDRLKPGRGILYALACMAAVAIVCLALASMCQKAEGATFEQAALAAIADPSVSEVKRDLFRQALAHGQTEQACHVSLYHPREAGAAWEDWTGTRSGTLVRPGVASCTRRHWAEWEGAWLWVRGYGVCHVEDCFQQSTSRTWFDLAADGPPYRYGEWLADLGRARWAKAFGKRPGTFVVLKPRGGYEQ